MKLADMMLTDEHRQELESCRTVGGYEGACDATDTVCRECLNRERAAIANAVMVLADKGLFAPWKWINAPLDDKSEGKQLTEAFALLAECRNVAGGK